MGQAFAKAESQPQVTVPEYSIYIYHHPENQHEGQNDWEKRSTTVDLKEALDEAISLHQSEGYCRVEIMKRLVDPETAQAKDQVLKVFAHEKLDVSFEAKLAISAVLLAACILSVKMLGLV